MQRARLFRLLENLDPGLREVFFALLEEIDQQRAGMLSREDLREVKAELQRLSETQEKTWEAIRELAEAQKRTEERVNELAEAQKRTEEELREFRKRTEEEFKRVWKAIEELAEAQKRTEEEIRKLVERQNRLEERVNHLDKVVKDLIEAQKRTEEELRKLTREHRKTREMLGALQHSVGYMLEDRAYTHLPRLLEEEFGIRLIEPLRRRYIEVAPRRYEEVNLIGKGLKEGREVWILGECKSQLRKRDVDSFLARVKRLESFFPGEKFLLLVTYQTPPPVEDYVKEKGLVLYYSYRFPL